MKWPLGVLISVILISASCSVAPSKALEPDSESVTVQSAPVEEAVEPEKPAPMDEEVMYHLLAAEVMGAGGDISGAAGAYLEAALLSADPKIAERATHVAISAGEWSMVALASDRWAALDPASLAALEIAAGARLREGDYAGAEFRLAQILELTTTEPARGWGIVAAMLSPASDPSRAGKLLENLLTEFDAGSNVDALFARSRLAANNGDLEGAARLADMAIELDPERAELLAWSGRLAVNLDNASLALQHYRRAWRLDPENQQIALSYAELLKRQDDLAGAQRVLAGLPDEPEMRFMRIVFALDADDRETAERLYRGFASAAYPDSSEAAFQAAQSAEMLDYPDQAIDWYSQVTGDRAARSRLRQAALQADLGNVSEARKLLVRLRVEGDRQTISQSYQAEAFILQEADRDEESMQVLNEALVLLPADVSLRYSRALLAVGMGELEAAERDLRTILSVEPDNVAAINALGYTLADLTERYEEAEQLILKAYELRPEDASIIDSMGWISYRLGRLAEAEKYLREAWETQRNAEIAAHLGEVLWVVGKKQEARALWKLGGELDTGNETLLETLKRFGELP